MLIPIKILTWMASPLGILTWGGSLAVLLMLLRWKKTGVTLLALSVIQVVVFSLPVVSKQLLGSLEQQARELAAKNRQAERILSGQKYGAIILLGGATSPASPPERPHPDLGDAADRIWHAARLYRQGIAPKIIISGGRIPGMEANTGIQTEAQAMRLMLLDLGVPDKALVLEDAARTTRENAEKTKQFIGQQPAALVTSAFHMPRSMRNFLKTGMKVDAYPTDFRVSPAVEPLWIRLLPRADELRNSEAAIKEYIALAINY
jgi:uncharacterized SAM-binding protein YcdF (DUF218 family)